MIDLISRQQAIDAIHYEYDDCCNIDESGSWIADDIERIIDNVPSVQPERKVGKWIKDKSWSEGGGMRESYGHYWKCNQCNNIVKGDWSQCGDNFCSECGADMRGEVK